MNKSTCVTPRGLFGDSLGLLDRSVGRLHSLLDELGIATETVTIYSADNGGSLHWGILGGVNGDLRCGKGTLWEGGVRVPGLVRWPGVIAPGRVVSALTSSLDWLPTFSALAGFELDNDRAYDGWDMSTVLFGKEQQHQISPTSRRDRFFYHTSEDATGDLVAVRLGAYKLHFLTKGSHCDSSFPDAECYAAPNDRRQSGGLLFNVETDVSEVLPYDHNSDAYKIWAPKLWKMAYDYTRGWQPAASETAKGSSKDRFPCCTSCSPMPDCCSCNR